MQIEEQIPALQSPREAFSRGPELLAPAGDWDCARAAVENGADAIYFGLEKFNARMRAHNFTEADLPPLMEYLHRRGVKGYVTFNTLVFQNEMGQAEQYARAIITAGVDAAIVQDVGICRLIRQLSPDFPIHVSTQMTITSAAGVAFARELGCNLVVLARECSLLELDKIQIAQTQAGIATRLPLEVFVHGALCVAYSGQCLTSEALGGRSANRGECAQACRMPYELISDGQLVPLGDRKYLLSPQDLAGLKVLPELVRLGIASLKIEGRLKAPEYVANITRIYREEIDRLAGGGPERGQEARDARRVHAEYDMEMAFSRGLYTGWFGGVNNQELVHARFGKKRGVYLGEIAEVQRECVVLQLEGPLKPGDGVVFDAGHPEEKEEGGRVYEVRRIQDDGRTVLLAFGQGDINWKRIARGNKLWKTSDPELERQLRQSYAGEAPRHQRPLWMEAHGHEGVPFSLVVSDHQGHEVRVTSSMPLVRAERTPLDELRLRDQLGRLGGTGYRLDGLAYHLEAAVMLPVSELNRLRREAVAQLDRQRSAPLRWSMQDGPVGLAEEVAAASPPSKNRSEPRLVVLTRTLAQLDCALENGVQTIYCEFEDPKKYRDAVARVRSQRSGKYPEIFVAPPRIFKMGEEWILKQVRSAEADGWLVRNFDHLAYFQGERCVGDYSLNVSNRQSAAYFLKRYQLERLTASYDLNFTQLEALLRAAPPSWFEITIHQHIPMFHMEHCVFCAFLSAGTDYRNCGRPCDIHDLKLRDRVGAEHPVKADAGCRNTVFNSRAQTGAEYVSAMLDLGARDFRLEFLNETPQQMQVTLKMYRALLRREITPAEIWRELKLLNQLGVTRGQIGVPA
jgi:putative protease